MKFGGRSLKKILKQTMTSKHHFHLLCTHERRVELFNNNKRLSDVNCNQIKINRVQDN